MRSGERVGMERAQCGGRSLAPFVQSRSYPLRAHGPLRTPLNGARKMEYMLLEKRVDRIRIVFCQEPVGYSLRRFSARLSTRHIMRRGAQQKYHPSSGGNVIPPRFYMYGVISLSRKDSHRTPQEYGKYMSSSRRREPARRRSATLRILPCHR